MPKPATRKSSPSPTTTLEIRGIVSPPGAGGGTSPGDKLRTLHLTLQPWKFPEGKLHLNALRATIAG